MSDEFANAKGFMAKSVGGFEGFETLLVGGVGVATCKEAYLQPVTPATFIVLIVSFVTKALALLKYSRVTSYTHAGHGYLAEKRSFTWTLFKSSFLGVIRMAARMVARGLRSKLLPMFTPTATQHSHATHFGFKDVNEKERRQLVGNGFTTWASDYEALMSDLMNGGLYKLWEDMLISKLGPFPGMKHLDVAGGTGDVAFRILETIIETKGEEALHKDTQIYVYDNNPSMLNVGKKRAQQRGLGDFESLVWIQGDAERLTFADNSMDSYTIAFGMRNATHIEKVLAEAHRVLKKGGTFLCLELCHDCAQIFKHVYDLYSFSDIPALGERVPRDRNPFEYLLESALRFPPKEVFASMIEDVGFRKTGYLFLVGGVTIHHALKV
ncbi:hypothetical protein QVD17_22791 [Tagetes erecta]|uniref:2-methoxy-6-polyprenyl-1,4-benzoquinol methylase, mitochondrial n=1 Tax=Tagetes erecta TaxID=13708 RepID=A0AAD8KI91_TARER|nr:hypothetical protein QVD17_22791 [Tagetes erecta]